MTEPAPAPPPPPPGWGTFALLEAGTLLAVGLSFWPTRGFEGWWWAGLFVGLVAGIAYWNPFRAGGLAPFGLTIALGGILPAVFWGWQPASAIITAGGAGLTLGGLNTAGKFWTVPPAPLAWRIGYALLALAVGLGPGSAVGLGYADGAAVAQANTIAAAGVLGAAVLAWLRLLRPAFELAVEPLLWLMYRVRPTGPGLAAVPPRGPCLVIANHACWFDPMFLGKILPRRTIPMMTERFYDLPVIGWLMRRFGVIRVPERALKHDAPEIAEAIAALDRGECVVIFPEGFLRRTEEKPLRRFGRGVWHILKARPGTPVFACWIEGAWGSYASYKDGPPTKNKRRDWGRPISVGVIGPVVVGAEILESHLPTRVFLMNKVLEARAVLGLPELPPVALPDKDGDDGEGG